MNVKKDISYRSRMIIILTAKGISNYIWDIKVEYLTL